MKPTSVVLLLAAAGCGTAYHERLLPSPESPSPSSGPGFLRAGFAKIDFTPPPGVGLAGNGPDGLQSDGWRLHLYARAMVLEDPSGERIAFVIADLTHISTSLHRQVADRVARETGIGADRLVLSATHTHSGPSHFYAEASYNNQSSRLGGYDPEVERHLVTRIAESVRVASASLTHAWASWSITSLDSVTRNRSMTAYCRNDPADLPEECPVSLTLAGADSSYQRRTADSAHYAGKFQNHQLAILRIDTLAGGQRRLASFLSVYSIHSTGNSNAATLLDSDIHGLVMAKLERSLGGGPGSRAIGLFLNGTEGDASPAIDTTARCPRPALGAAAPVTAVRGIDRRYDFVTGSANDREECLRRARREVVRVATRLAEAIQERLATVPAQSHDDEMPIRRAFTTLWLPGDSALCAAPAVGTAAIGGAEDAQPRVWRWEPLSPFLHFRLHEGGKAVLDPPIGCQREKHQIAIAQKLFVGAHGLPETAQVTVVRLGSVGVGALPAEVTTIAGRNMRRAMATAIGGDAREEGMVLIGLANGFIQYVNTAAEYRAQSYEGGSNLYGPGTAAVLARTLASLASDAFGDGRASRVVVGPIIAYPGEPKAIMADSIGKRATLTDRRLEIECRRDAVRATWRDLDPGLIPPWRGDTIVVFVADQDGTKVVDGDAEVAIRVRGGHRDGSHDWEAVWVPDRNISGVRVLLPAHRQLPALEATLRGSCGGPAPVVPQ